MWYHLFAEILDRGVVASVIILVVLIVRGAMCRFPKKYLYLLWMIVAVRLVCPIGVNAPFSLFRVVGEDVQTFSVNDINLSSVGTVADFVDPVNTKDNPVLSADAGIDDEDPDLINEVQNTREDGQQDRNADSSAGEKASGYANSRNPLVQYGTIVWLIGMMAILFRNLFMVFRMRKHLEKAVRYRGNIYESDNIPSPFVMGIMCPKIYIPFRLDEEEREYILMHEQYHIKRRDYLVKLFAFLLLCVYWFHPLVWVSYILMLRDMEMSCDEYVLQHVKKDIRKRYSQSLLGFALNQRSMTVGLLAFGETGTRRRVRNVLNFKKYGKWMSMVALALIFLVGLVCLTDVNAETARQKSDTGQQSGDTTRSGSQNISKEIGEMKEIYWEQTEDLGFAEESSIKLESDADHTGLRLAIDESSLSLEGEKELINENHIKMVYKDFDQDGIMEIVLLSFGGSSGTFQNFRVVKYNGEKWELLPMEFAYPDDMFVEVEVQKDASLQVDVEETGYHKVINLPGNEYLAKEGKRAAVGVGYHFIEIEDESITVAYRLYVNNVGDAVGDIRQKICFDEKYKKLILGETGYMPIKEAGEREYVKL